MVGAGFLAVGSASAYFLADSVSDESINFLGKVVCYGIALTIPLYTALEGAYSLIKGSALGEGAMQIQKVFTRDKKGKLEIQLEIKRERIREGKEI